MEQHISQDEIKRIIISNMVKKKNPIVPVIGEDTVLYHLSVPLILLWFMCFASPNIIIMPKAFVY